MIIGLSEVRFLHKKQKANISKVLKIILLLVGIIFLISAAMILILNDITKTTIAVSIIFFILGVSFTAVFMNKQINKEDRFNK